MIWPSALIKLRQAFQIVPKFIDPCHPLKTLPVHQHHHNAIAMDGRPPPSCDFDFDADRQVKPVFLLGLAGFGWAMSPRVVLAAGNYGGIIICSPPKRGQRLRPFFRNGDGSPRHLVPMPRCLIWSARMYRYESNCGPNERPKPSPIAHGDIRAHGFNPSRGRLTAPFTC